MCLELSTGPRRDLLSEPQHGTFSPCHQPHIACRSTVRRFDRQGRILHDLANTTDFSHSIRTHFTRAGYDMQQTISCKLLFEVKPFLSDKRLDGLVLWCFEAYLSMIHNHGRRSGFPLQAKKKKKKNSGANFLPRGTGPVSAAVQSFKRCFTPILVAKTTLLTSLELHTHTDSRSKHFRSLPDERGARANKQTRGPAL